MLASIALLQIPSKRGFHTVRAASCSSVRSLQDGGQWPCSVADCTGRRWAAVPGGSHRLLLVCGVVRAGARHPRAHQPDQAARLSPARIASIATLCTLPCSPLGLDSRRSTNGPPLPSMVCFYLHAFISVVVLCEERTLGTQFDGEYEDFCRRVPRWIPRSKS